MATKDDVIKLHRQYPHMTAKEMARELGCLPEYVHATARRNNLRLPSAKQQPSIKLPSVIQLGRRAVELGLTLDDIERAARQRA
jgi:hypothetical protein